MALGIDYTAQMIRLYLLAIDIFIMSIEMAYRHLQY